MKKKLISGLIATMMVMSLAACNKTEGNTTQTTGATTPALTAADYKEYVTLGDYKTVVPEADASTLEVTQDEIQQQIDACLAAYAETKQVTEGVTKDGDTINLDYSGLLDGVAFANGTATDTTYTIGGNFIEDLDRGLIGLEIGKEYEIPCTFPETYTEETLKGKDVVFVVTVNSVSESILPEYNDEFVKTMTADSDEVLNTTAELEESIISYLTDSKLSTYNSAIYGSMMTQILDGSEITGVPESELTKTADMIRENAEYEFSTYGPMYGISDFDTYITSVYSYASIDDFNNEVNQYAQEYMYEKMIVTIIAEEEGINITEDEILAYGEELVASSSAYESFDALKEAYGDSIIEDITYELLYNAVYNKIVEYGKANM